VCFCDLARSFTWLGLTAFGGRVAHVAIMQRAFVERRAWVTRERFVDLLGLASLRKRHAERHGRSVRGESHGDGESLGRGRLCGR
jgi:hypothetical protein